MKIIIDAMGGDNAPEEIVHGAIEAAQAYGVDLTLVGRGDEILEAMREGGIDTLPAGVEILNADDVVDMHDEATDVLTFSPGGDYVRVKPQPGHPTEE